MRKVSDSVLTVVFFTNGLKIADVDFHEKLIISYFLFDQMLHLVFLEIAFVYTYFILSTANDKFFDVLPFGLFCIFQKYILQTRLKY